MIFRRNPPTQPPAPGKTRMTLRDHAIIIEKTLAELGLNPEQVRTQAVPDQEYSWQFKRGSAIIQLHIFSEEGRSYFQVLSPILHLPQVNLLAMYRRMLELNLKLTHAAFGLHMDEVYVFSERILDGLDMGEAAEIIALVAGYADDLDNQLVNEFGGRLYGQI
jgi:hypothetical protein